VEGKGPCVVVAQPDASRAGPRPRHLRRGRQNVKEQHARNRSPHAAGEGSTSIASPSCSDGRTLLAAGVKSDPASAAAVVGADAAGRSPSRPEPDGPLNSSVLTSPPVGGVAAGSLTPSVDEAAAAAAAGATATGDGAAAVVSAVSDPPPPPLRPAAAGIGAGTDELDSTAGVGPGGGDVGAGGKGGTSWCSRALPLAGLLPGERSRCDLRSFLPVWPSSSLCIQIPPAGHRQHGRIARHRKGK